MNLPHQYLDAYVFRRANEYSLKIWQRLFRVTGPEIRCAELKEVTMRLGDVEPGKALGRNTSASQDRQIRPHLFSNRHCCIDLHGFSSAVQQQRKRKRKLCSPIEKIAPEYFILLAPVRMTCQVHPGQRE